MSRDRTQYQEQLSIESIFELVSERDIRAIDFTENPLKGSTELFEIRTTILKEKSGEYIPVYGIYNVITGIREAEIRQYMAAKDWCKTLTTLSKGGEMPGLEITQLPSATPPEGPQEA